MEQSPRPALTSSRVLVDGWEIHAVQSNTAPRRGPAVVLVHGWGVAGRYLHPLAEQLAADFPVYVPELPGHGLSTRPRDAMTIHELTDTLAAWMEAAHVGQAVLVGQSFGCQIASALAVRYPDRVAGLVLIGPTVDARARTLLRQIPRLVGAGLWEQVSLMPIVVRDYRRMGFRRLRGELRQMFADAIEMRLPLINLPGLVIRGVSDTVVPLRWAREVGALLGDAPVVTIPGGAHAVQFSQPGLVAREIARFILEFVSCRNRPASDDVWPGVSIPSLACPSPADPTASRSPVS